MAETIFEKNSFDMYFYFLVPFYVPSQNMEAWLYMQGFLPFHCLLLRSYGKLLYDENIVNKIPVKLSLW